MFFFACLSLHLAAFVTVDPRNRSLPGGAVSLEGLGLVGTIPRALFALPELIELNLEVNQLEGQLPDPLCSEDTTLEVRRIGNCSTAQLAGPSCMKVVWYICVRQAAGLEPCGKPFPLRCLKRLSSSS
jgi:hypothetical protein